MELTWLEKAEARGFEKGMAQIVEEMRQAVLRRVEQRFGFVPEDLSRQIQAMDSFDPLIDVLTRLALAKSPDELVSGG